MRFMDQVLGGVLLHARQHNGQLYFQPETAFATRADAYGGGDAGIIRHFQLFLGGHRFHCADETGRIAHGEQLFGVIAFAPAAAQFFRRGEFHGQRTIGGHGTAVAASGSGGTGAVENIDGHGAVPFGGY